MAVSLAAADSSLFLLTDATKSLELLLFVFTLHHQRPHCSSSRSISLVVQKSEAESCHEAAVISMYKGLRCWMLRKRRRWGSERGEDTREWRTSALCLINQPGSGPAGFPQLFQDGGPGLQIIPNAPNTSAPKVSTQAGPAQNPGCKGPQRTSAQVRTSRGDGDASRRRRELFKEVPVVSGGQEPFHVSTQWMSLRFGSGDGLMGQVVGSAAQGRAGRLGLQWKL